MARKWRDVRRKFSPEVEQQIKARVAARIATLPLAEIRAARQQTQVQLAKELKVDQASVSKLERRADMYLSTLRSYIEAMGGHLDIRAVFPEGELVIERLVEEESHTGSKAKPKRGVEIHAKRASSIAASASR